jgi:uncharacterized protein
MPATTRPNEVEQSGPGLEENDLESMVVLSSRYNFSVPVENGCLLYNAKSGAVLRFSGADAGELASVLCDGLFELRCADLPEPVFLQLKQGGFLVDIETDELKEIRDRFWAARISTPLVVTLTTTMNCNLGCYYCYESRSGERLSTQHISEIVTWVTQRLNGSSNRALHVDWYGGEPLMNADFINAASEDLQRLCLELKAFYSASIISNGTLWPDDIGDFVTRHRIRQVQVSFDGLPANHNQRRHFRNGYKPRSSVNSFDVIATLVDKLLDYTRVDIRINLDRQNQSDLIPFVDFARERGWFSKPFPAVIQPARLAAFSERSAFMRRVQITATEYDSLRTRLRELAGCDVQIEEAEVPDGFPYPKTSVCAALANKSFVVGADALIYRCGLQVGEKQRAVGSISPAVGQPTLAHAFADSVWWDKFDPTTLPNCSRCSFLPICWGGCPKKHLENDTHALEEQSIYWRTNLPRLIAGRFGLSAPAGFRYSEKDQFR